MAHTARIPMVRAPAFGNVGFSPAPATKVVAHLYRLRHQRGRARAVPVPIQRPYDHASDAYPKN